MMSQWQLDQIIQKSIETAVDMLSKRIVSKDFYSVEEAATKTGFKISRIQEGIFYKAIPAIKSRKSVKIEKDVVNNLAEYINLTPALKKARLNKDTKQNPPLPKP
jgi:methylmalonyl-CoA mutase N-terminal domain/subunit